MIPHSVPSVLSSTARNVVNIGCLRNSCVHIYVHQTTSEVLSRTLLWPRHRQGAGYLCYGWPMSYDHRPSHPYYAGTEHVGFSPTRQTRLAGGGGGRRKSRTKCVRVYLAHALREQRLVLSLNEQHKYARECTSKNRTVLYFPTLYHVHAILQTYNCVLRSRLLQVD